MTCELSQEPMKSQSAPQSGTALCDPVHKNSPSNEGDSGSVPGRGTKIPHTTAKTQCNQINKVHPGGGNINWP